jgi:hypothetical protein
MAAIASNACVLKREAVVLHRRNHAIDRYKMEGWLVLVAVAI